MEACPCGSEQSFENCCQRILSGQKNAETPEELMRSRYTAYVLVDMDHIEKTMLGKASLKFNKKEMHQSAKNCHWLGLEVLDTKTSEKEGFVEFKAHYTSHGQKNVLHEYSRFIKHNGCWYYERGRSVQKPIEIDKKIGRNDPCHCGSKKKYKHCCHPS